MMLVAAAGLAAGLRANRVTRYSIAKVPAFSNTRLPFTGSPSLRLPAQAHEHQVVAVRRQLDGLAGLDLDPLLAAAHLLTTSPSHLVDLDARRRRQ